MDALMSVKRYDKLVRDRIPEIIRKSGKEPETEVVPQAEAIEYLARKLREEADEYLESREAEELADVLEVVYALAAETGLTLADLEALRARKAAERGAFHQRIVLKAVRTPEEG